VKSWFGLVGAVLPVAYCGGLLYYFLDFSGSVGQAKAIGLGPTLLGLGIVGLLLCIPLLIRIVRLVARSPGRDDDTNGFDADAVIARYKANQAAAPERPVARERPAPGFGRRR
jgi:hypothetical protein